MLQAEICSPSRVVGLREAPSAAECREVLDLSLQAAPYKGGRGQVAPDALAPHAHRAALAVGAQELVQVVCHLLARRPMRR